MQTARGVIATEILILTRVRSAQGVSGGSYIRCARAEPFDRCRRGYGHRSRSWRRCKDEERERKPEAGLHGHKNSPLCFGSGRNLRSWSRSQRFRSRPPP